MAKFVNGYSLSYKFEEFQISDHYSNFTNITAALVPHGHLSKINSSIQKLLNEFDEDNFPDTILTIATSHYSKKNILIPYDLLLEAGPIKVNRSFSKMIQQALNCFGIAFGEDYEKAQKEHSWRIFMHAFKQKADLLDRKIEHASLLFGDPLTELSVLAECFNSILQNSKKRILLLISGDMTHFGSDYKNSLFPDLNGAQLVEKIKEFDLASIDLILSGEFDQYQERIKETNYCARNQVLILKYLSLGKPHLLDYQQYHLNEFDVFDKNIDNLFSGAVILYGARKNSELLCYKNKLIRCNNEFFLYHLCHNKLLKLNFLEVNIVSELFKNNLDFNSLKIENLTNRLKVNSIEDKIVTFKKKLLESHFMAHKLEYANSLTLNMSHRLESLIESNQIYSKHDLSFEKLPILTSNVLKEHWSELGGNDQYEKNMYYRTTSGTTDDNRLITKYPKRIDLYRNQASELDSFSLPKFDEKVIINRKDNLNSKDENFDYKYDEKNKTSYFALESNPYLVADSKWKEIVNKISHYNSFALYSDPHFAYCFYLYCFKNNIDNLKINYIHLSHSYAWKYMLSALRKFFKAHIINELRSSELITIASQCPLNQFHLNEDNILFQYQADERIDGEGLIATTLDTDYRPLVKYYSGDLVKRIECKCHVKGQAIQFLGRESELLEINDNYITMSDLDNLISDRFDIKAIQFSKNSEKLKINYELVCSSDSKRDEFESYLRNEFIDLYGIHVVFENFKARPIKRGKFKTLKES